METKSNKKRWLICAVAAVLVGSSFLGLNLGGNEARALSTEEICRRSEECQAAVEKKKEADRNAAAAAQSANAYQSKVAEISAEIADKELEIAETEVKIDDLTKEIKEAEKKLKSDQEALAELLVNMHFESDAEPIQILAGASSISDLAEKAAREEVAKEQISVTAASVRQTKESLEYDKTEVEALLVQQQQAKEAMLAKKEEQEALVAKYENDAESYNQMAKAALAEQQAAIQAWQEEHKEDFGGNAYAGGVNTYPWQADCPGRQDDYLTYWDNHKIGGYVCECVSYAGWKAYETYGVAPAWGHAYSWASGAANAGYTVNHTPAAGTIGQIGGAPYGHVFWVESVNGDGSINVTEYNNAYATYLYSGHSHYGDFGARIISAGEASRYNYIHFR